MMPVNDASMAAIKYNPFHYLSYTGRVDVSAVNIPELSEDGDDYEEDSVLVQPVSEVKGDGSRLRDVRRDDPGKGGIDIKV